jgi:type I restriction enzyme, S subunit
MRVQLMAPGDRYVPWLKETKPDWCFKPIKYTCSLNKNTLAEDTDPDKEIIYIDIGSVDSNGGWTSTEPMPFSEAPSRARRVIIDGDVLISTVRTYLRAITYIKKVTGNLICSTGFAVVSPGSKVNPGFLSYWVRSNYFIDEIVARSTGVSYPAINASDIGNLPLPVLHEKDQLAIASFLDRKTEQIDNLITKKQRQIELLQEKRYALISHAVTKGLNPDVKMKDSGVEWLGEIPEHWDLIKIKLLSLVKRGASPRPIDDPIYFDDQGEYSWVRIADVTASVNYLTITTQRLTELGKSLSIPLEPGDLFLSIAGSVGKPIITKIKCCIHDGCVYFPNYNQNKKFLYYIFASGQPYLGLGKMGTQLNLNTDTVGDIKIGLPPVREQQIIADFLDKETQKMNAVISAINMSITTLQEYRSALISAAVTGKIDVLQEVT